MWICVKWFWYQTNGLIAKNFYKSWFSLHHHSEYYCNRKCFYCHPLEYIIMIIIIINIILIIIIFEIITNHYIFTIRRSKKQNMFSVLPLWKKGRRRHFFFLLFFLKMAAGHIFQNNRPAYFFKMAARHTWQFSQQMEKLMRESKNIKCDLSI